MEKTTDNNISTNLFILLIAFLFLVTSCKKQDNEVKNENASNVKVITFKNSDPKYLSDPSKSDTLCINDIERAKKDINRYHKLFIKTICFGCLGKPFEEEIKEVLKKRQIQLVIEDIGCVVWEGQTQGCYSGYINLKMKEQYGENYFSEIEKEAENLLIKNIIEKNKVLSIYDLDDKEKPKIISPDRHIEGDYYTKIKVDLPVKIESSKSLFVEITFIIEKDGTISNLSVSNWVNEAIDEKFKKDLIALALKTLKEEYNHWNPGKYKGNISRVENTLRIRFENKFNK